MRFVCLLSPTKTFAKDLKPVKVVKSSLAAEDVLSKPRSTLMDYLRGLKKSELKSLMGLSDSLAELNHQRHQELIKCNDDKEAFYYKAGYYFDGPSFQKLNINTINNDDDDAIKNLNDSLIVLSGLYGMLRPNDYIQPYRFEMGTKNLSIQNEGSSNCKNLYEFWSNYQLTDILAKNLLTNHNGDNEEDDVKSSNDDKVIILNCASQEYYKVLDSTKLQLEYNIPILDIVFKSAEKKTLPSVYAKQARGMFVRFVAKTKPQTIQDLQQFTGDGHYLFSSSSIPEEDDDLFTLNDEKNKKKKKQLLQLVFDRYNTPQGPGDDEKSINDSSSSSKKKGKNQKKRKATPAPVEEEKKKINKTTTGKKSSSSSGKKKRSKK